MSTIPTLTVTPSSAATAAYARVQNGDLDAPGDASGFGDVLSRAIQGVVDTGHTADNASMQAIAGQGSLTDVATAVTKAELALQTALAVRDKVVSAYQEVSRMTI